ncbi:MAG TPA: acyl-CoA dehydrogenase family protein [Xanthobacteraceae bacterium]|jgi:acyl-CoA dehydrogenase
MNIRTAKVLEMDDDIHVARNAARGIMAVAGNLRARGTTEFAARTAKVAAVAAECAGSVDSDSRFPEEAIVAARAERLLGIAVPREFGGEGAGIAEVIDVCYTLGRACASTAMIYAMHQASLACITRHGRSASWHQLLLRRVCDEQMLLASSTTEGQAGGDLRNSVAAIGYHGPGIALDRKATVISYGNAADAIVTTARRSAEAASSDQVLVAFLKQDYTLEPLSGWDALGMRGTCSEGFRLVASGSSEQILPVSYDKIHTQTMMPVAHLLWSATWAGIATAAVERARAFVRKAAHRSGGTLPPAAAHLTHANATLRTLRGMIAVAVQRFEAADAATLETIDFQSGMNLHKVSASELAVTTVMSAMRTCGLSGYRNDGDFSIGRHLRDILSSPIMISNDRILANIATTSLLTGAPDSLTA